MKIQKSVFIITYGRTGSTLLAKILNTIPGYTIRGENNNTLWYLFQALKKANHINNYQGPKSFTVNGPWYGAPFIKYSDFNQEIVNSFIRNILVPEEDTRVIGFKEIRYFDITESQDFFEYLDFIRDSFPDVKFIFNTREPIQTSKSAWWKNEDQTLLIKRFSELGEWFYDYSVQNPTICFNTTYEQFTGDGIKHLRNLFDFLGEEMDHLQVQQALIEKLNHCKA